MSSRRTLPAPESRQIRARDRCDGMEIRSVVTIKAGIVIEPLVTRGSATR
jgi:hypothetical protein